MNLYLDSGYVNIRGILSLGLPFNFLVGGRATGKTYTSLKIAKEDSIRFMFMRRTQSQADIINKPEFSPFKKLNTNEHWSVGSKKLSKYNAGFYETEIVDDKPVFVGSPIGYTCALSTISNIRGFDASDVDLIIYDEFIPEKHERPIKNESDAFLNAYETINRNRELEGQKPVQVLCLANPNDLGNPLFMGLKLIRKAENMKRKGQEISIDRERGMCIILLDRSDISKQKEDTALYRLTQNTQFSRMALSNEFANEERGRIKSRNLREYIPIVSIGEICIYRHKSRSDIYVSPHTLGSPPTYSTGDTERKRFRRTYYWVWDEYIRNNIEFEEYLCEMLLTKYFT